MVIPLVGARAPWPLIQVHGERIEFGGLVDFSFLSCCDDVQYPAGVYIVKKSINSLIG